MLEKFIAGWQGAGAEENAKKNFIRFRDVLTAFSGVQLEFVAREGVTYSLRGRYGVDLEGEAAGLFVMVDVIEDSPRWLSVCFYADMINDPDSRGDFVPEGLLGKDALCFDMESCEDGFACMDMGAHDERLTAYLEERIKEAYSTVAQV